VVVSGYEEVKAVTTSEHGDRRGNLVVTNLIFTGGGAINVLQ
jgi:hypothetical protein